MKKNTAEYHSESIARMANTLCAVLNVDNVAEGGELEDLVRYAFAGEADHAILFHPAALGSDVCDRFAALLDGVKDNAPYRMDFVVPHPANSKNSLNTMYAGVPYDKNNPHPTLFDAGKGKRRMAIVANKHHRWKTEYEDVERIWCDTDMQAVRAAIDMVKQDCYDLLIVCVCEFDMMMQATPLYGTRCEMAFDNHVKEFTLLCDAAQVYQSSNVFVGYCPDYGAHKGFLCGKHNRHYPSDLNVTHYYGVISGLKSTIQQIEEEGKQAEEPQKE